MARDFAKPFYDSKEWKATREYVLMRDKYLCQVCGAPAEEVHHKEHLSPENIGDPRVTMSPDNLVSLCRACHFEQHRGEHGSGREKEEAYPYTFDENGKLVRKRSPL